MKKVFGQTVRDLKRGVNKKVLKVPGIEQKILDATSNEPLGPHGSVMAELAQASRNYHECQLIMAVIWKRINDTGKNWRHVFKALTVLEYLVAHGSERVIDEIWEHAYQISTLADFQYIDSNGRDQGSNIRRKSQVLVALVNSKEKIQEIRLKAQSSKDKYNGAPSSGGDRYENGHNGNRDDERSGYGRDRELGYRDDDRNGKGRDSFSNDGDRDSRDYDERYGKGNYREGNSDGSVDYQTRPRSQSADGYTDRSFHDDDRYSSRSGGKADDQSQDESLTRELDQRHSEQSVGKLPSYEEATSVVQNTARDERDGENVAASPQVSSTPVSKPNSPSKSTGEGPDNDVASDIVADPNNGFDAFDEFDPRGAASVAPPAASSQDLDIFGFSAPDSANSLAMVTTISKTTTFEDDLLTDTGFGTNFGTLSSTTASTNQAQTNEDPFGDAPFKAIPQDNFHSQPQNFQPVASFQPSQTLPSAAPKVDSFASFNFGNGFGGLTYAPSDVNGQHPSGSPPFSAPELHAELSSDDILDSILPRTGFYSQEAQSAAPTNMQTAQMNFLPHPELSTQVASQGIPTNSQNFQINPFQSSGFSACATNAETVEMNPFQTSGQSAPVVSQESPTNSQDFFLHSTASQGSPGNIQSTQESLPQPATSQGSLSNMPSGTSSPHGTQTNVQSAELNFFQSPGSTTQGNFLQPSGVSVPATSQGSVRNMTPGTSSPQGPQTNVQSAEINFFQPPGSPTLGNFLQPSGVSVPATSQGSVTIMPSRTSAPQGPQTNKSAETNFFQPSGLSGQSSQGNMQPAKMNLFQPSGICETPALPESQTTPQTTNMSFFPSSGLPAPVATTSPTNMQTTQSASPTNMQSDQFNLGSQSMLSEPRASQVAQVSAPINMQTARSGAPITMQTVNVNHWPQSMLSDPLASKTGQVTAPNYMQVTGHAANIQPTYLNLSSQPTLSDSRALQTAHAAPPSNTQATQFGAPAYMQTSHMMNLGSHSMLSDPFASQAAPATVVPPAKSQSMENFQPKSTVWADTLSRGLVNFNISGPKTNPLDDIGVDFDAINRKEKRLEAKRSSAPPAVSTITMGKAMGSGSGLGRSAAGSLAPAPNPTMGSGMGGMGMGGGGGMGMGMGRGGGMGMGMGAGMNMGGYGGNMNHPHMGMMNMAMRPGVPGWPPNGMLPQAPGMPGSGYNPTMGMGGYGMQQPYGGGYR